MTAVGSISEVGYTSMLTRDLAASMRNAADMFGLIETESNGKKAFFTAQNKHHEVVYTQSDRDGLDHIGLVVPNAIELDAIRAKVDRNGYQIVSENPIEDYIEQGFAFDFGADGIELNCDRSGALLPALQH